MTRLRFHSIWAIPEPGSSSGAQLLPLLGKKSKASFKDNLSCNFKSYTYPACEEKKKTFTSSVPYSIKEFRKDVSPNNRNGLLSSHSNLSSIYNFLLCKIWDIDFFLRSS